MTDYIALEAPAWLWLASIFGLIAIGGACIGLLVYALGLRQHIRRQDAYEERIATVDHVDTIAASLHKRVTKLERKPQVHALWPRDDEATDTTISPALRP